MKKENLVQDFAGPTLNGQIYEEIEKIKFDDLNSEKNKLLSIFKFQFNQKNIFDVIKQ